jgi:hypothetical protein
MAKNAENQARAQMPTARHMRSSSNGFRGDSDRTISTIHHPGGQQRAPRSSHTRQIFDQDPTEVPYQPPKYLAPKPPQAVANDRPERIVSQNAPRPRSESVDNVSSHFLPSAMNSKRNMPVADKGQAKPPGKVTVTTKEEDGVLGSILLPSKDHLQRVPGVSRC